MSVFLVDTNIFVYSLDSRDGWKRTRAIEVLNILGRMDTGVVTPQVLGEFFVTSTRRIPEPLSVPEAGRLVTDMARSWPVFDLTPGIVLEAIEGVQRHGMSYWDATLWATAKFHEVPYILTEDYRDGALVEGVRYLNPMVRSFDMAVLTGAPQQHR